MKKYFVKLTVISALILALTLAFASVTFADGNVYKRGERSKEVAEIQKALKALNLFNEEVTGYFGDKTEEAVKKFQKMNKLEADGVVGPSTLKALFGKTTISAVTTSRAEVERKKVNVTYTVKQGDTIWDIADDFNVTRDSILKYNNLTENSILKIGQKLTIPNVVQVVIKVPAASTQTAAAQPVKETAAVQTTATAEPENKNEILADLPDGIYVAKDGDTLDSIAEDFGVTVQALMELNGFAEGHVVQPEDELKIPEAEEVVQAANIEINSTVQLKGEYLGWYDQVQYMFEKNAVAVVTDLKTGKTFKVKRLYGRNHADVEPLTKEDTAIMKSLYGSWSWDRRAIIVTINGKNIAASMNGMPHGGQQITNNNFGGHFCIHFKGSKTHKGNRVDAAHQAAVKAAAGIK